MQQHVTYQAPTMLQLQKIDIFQWFYNTASEKNNNFGQKVTKTSLSKIFGIDTFNNTYNTYQTTKAAYEP